MKFEELKVEQLKKELSKLALPTTGNKVELQKRLLDEFKRRNMDIDGYEFDEKEEMEVSTRATTNNIDLSTMLAAMMEKMEIKFQEAQETSRANNEKLLAEVKEESKIMELKFQETSRANNEKLLAEVREVQETAKATSEKVQEISEAVNNRVECIEKHVSKIDKKLADLENDIGAQARDVDEKFKNLETKINDIQCHEGPVRIVPEISSRIKAPTFDGSAPFNVFKFQFETVANRNMWNNEEKALELILALKGNAAQVLESIPIGCRENYDDIMVALQRKYGGEHKRDIYRMELRGRIQKANESLQDFATEIERLVQLTYPGENHPFLDQFKIETFVNGIRDPEIKHAVFGTHKSTFAETVSYALTQETAKLLSKPQIYKVRNLEISTEMDRDEVSDLKARIQALEEKQGKARVKCYNCGKSGHFQRNCKAPRKRARSVSPPGNSKRANTKSSNESPLN